MLQNAERIAEELGDDKKRLQVRSSIGYYHIFKGGNPEIGWNYMESCFESTEITQDVKLVVPLGVNLCSSCIASGDYRRINRVAPGIISLIERSGMEVEFFGLTSNPYSHVLALWGLSTAFCQDFDLGENLLDKAISFARELDHPSTLGQIEFIYGAGLAWKGDGPRSSEHLQNAITYMEQSQTVWLLGAVWAWLGYARCLMEEHRVAVDLTEKGLKIHTDLGVPFWRSVCHWVCSYAHSQQNDVERARAHAERALECSLENNERHSEGITRAWLGRLIATKDAMQIQEAEHQILDGIKVLKETGVRASYYLGHLWLGEVYIEAGRREEALANLEKAEGMFREMGMDYWLGKAQEALGKL